MSYCLFCDPKKLNLQAFQFVLQIDITSLFYSAMLRDNTFSGESRFTPTTLPIRTGQALLFLTYS